MDTLEALLRSQNLCYITSSSRFSRVITFRFILMLTPSSCDDRGDVSGNLCSRGLLQWRRQRWLPHFRSLGNYAVISFYVFFLAVLAQIISSVITYSREELLDIKAMSTYQHHDQEYNFPEADPLFGPQLAVDRFIGMAD